MRSRAWRVRAGRHCRCGVRRRRCGVRHRGCGVRHRGCGVRHRGCGVRSSGLPRALLARRRIDELRVPGAVEADLAFDAGPASGFVPRGQAAASLAFSDYRAHLAPLAPANQAHTRHWIARSEHRRTHPIPVNLANAHRPIQLRPAPRSLPPRLLSRAPAPHSDAASRREWNTGPRTPGMPFPSRIPRTRLHRILPVLACSHLHGIPSEEPWPTKAAP
jgi:hypothetical protein